MEALQPVPYDGAFERESCYKSTARSSRLSTGCYNGAMLVNDRTPEWDRKTDSFMIVLVNDEVS